MKSIIVIIIILLVVIGKACTAQTVFLADNKYRTESLGFNRTKTERPIRGQITLTYNPRSIEVVLKSKVVNVDVTVVEVTQDTHQFVGDGLVVKLFLRNDGMMDYVMVYVNGNEYFFRENEIMIGE